VLLCLTYRYPELAAGLPARELRRQLLGTAQLLSEARSHAAASGAAGVAYKRTRWFRPYGWRWNAAVTEVGAPMWQQNLAARSMQTMLCCSLHRRVPVCSAGCLGRDHAVGEVLTVQQAQGDMTAHTFICTAVTRVHPV
jgi:hypothetical protein